MGANSSPSRVFKNKHMAGQYGNEQVTILNLEVVKVDAEKNLSLSRAQSRAQRAASYLSATASKHRRNEDAGN